MPPTISNIICNSPTARDWRRSLRCVLKNHGFTRLIEHGSCAASTAGALEAGSLPCLALAPNRRLSSYKTLMFCEREASRSHIASHIERGKAFAAKSVASMLSR
jgi:hypothetical protein